MNRTQTLRSIAALKRGVFAVRRSFTACFAPATLWSGVGASESDCRGGHASTLLGMTYPQRNEIRKPQGFGTLVQV